MRRIATLKNIQRRQFPGLNRIEYQAEDIERIEQESVTTCEAPTPEGAPADGQ